MRLYGFVLVICILGIAGCQQNGLDRSTAARLIENSTQFKAIKDIPSDWIPDQLAVPFDPSKCRGWTAEVTEEKTSILARMRVAESFGLVELDEIETDWGGDKNCAGTRTSVTLTDKGLSELDDRIGNTVSGYISRFPSLTMSVSRISGIKLDPSGTGASVEFVVEFGEKVEGYGGMIGSALSHIPSSYIARLELYDDGWRVKRLSSND